MSNVIYKFNCPLPHSKVVSYIGMTQNCLSRRLTLHLQNGSIKKHFEEYHGIKIDRNTIVQNTNIIDNANNRNKLFIKEALYILHEAPSINYQYDNLWYFFSWSFLAFFRPKNLSVKRNGIYGLKNHVIFLCLGNL